MIVKLAKPNQGLTNLAKVDRLSLGDMGARDRTEGIKLGLESNKVRLIGFKEKGGIINEVTINKININGKGKTFNNQGEGVISNDVGKGI